MSAPVPRDAALKKFLDSKVRQYEQPAFIEDDPVSIPHLFRKKQDIEIAGFFAALFAWGNRTIIINKSTELMRLMDMAPHEFITRHEDLDLRRFVHFKHRTFQPTDILYLIAFLQHHYRRASSLETAFFPRRSMTVEEALIHFHSYCFSLEDYPHRTTKHIATPARNANCKRLNMYLRWMVRVGSPVDFGLWKRVSPASLLCPMDVHVARVARHFGLLDRKAVDWTAALDLTARLREFDASDPAKYDYALFGLGVIERF